MRQWRPLTFPWSLFLIIFLIGGVDLKKRDTLHWHIDHQEVCSGTQNGRTMAGSQHRLADLQLMYENCTRVFGNLEITHLTETTLNMTSKQISRLNLSIFDHIEEIKGYLLIYNVDLRFLSFKNLKIIWGDELIDENSRNGALTISSNHKLTEIHMPNLRTIEKGNVRLENNTFLCYLKDGVNWDELLNFDRSRLSATSNAFRQCEKKFKCHSECTSGHCWSNKPYLCQQLYRTNCPASCQLSKQCYNNTNTLELECCDSTCTGGCTGPTANDCLACKELSLDGVCVSKCPEKMLYDRRLATRVPNPNGTYIHDRYCVKECPAHLLIDGEVCVRHCSIGKHHDMRKETRECEKCKGICPKVCFVNQPLTGSILRNLTDCEEIDGFIAIQDSKMTSKDGYSVKDLDVLKSIRMISEYVSVSTVHMSPVTLGFLENLEFIEGRQLSNQRHALEITKNDLLSSLNLKSLKTIKNGNVIIMQNVALCYADSINWSSILNNQSVAKVAENQGKAHCKKRGRICDKECDPLKGCWGSGSSMCLGCKSWKVEDKCISDCATEGFYRNQTSMTCLPCYHQCLQCSGPSELECDSCRKSILYDEHNRMTCVEECPLTHFTKDNQCLQCHPSCLEFGCSGPGNHLGAGGCNRCTFALVSVDKKVQQCLNGTEQDVCHQNNLINYFPAVVPHIEGVEKTYCEACHEECHQCRSGGNSVHSDECLCKNYKVQEHNDFRCSSECSTNTFEESPKTDTKYGVCKECHWLCDKNFGCSGPSPIECFKCAKASIDANGTTLCLEECPQEAPYLNDVYRECTVQDVKKLKKQRQAVIIIIVSLVFLILCSIVAVVFWKCRTIKDKLKKEIYEHAPAIPETIPMDARHKPNMSQLKVIASTDLQTKGKKLGEGAFGVVYAGYYFPKGKGNSRLPVAIKLIKSCENKSPQEDMELIEEATAMARLRHPNLLGFVGICFSVDGIQLITPLRPLGNLLDFLKKHKPHMSGKDLLLYCYQISSAMKYLFDHRVIHRDLAARNVLVKSVQHVQVTDFGLSKLLGVDQNEVEITGKVAYKWTAIEAIKTHCFNHQTDVWAFGVTCWEILTFGQSPYQGMDATTIYTYIRDGNRLRQPNNCSIELYQILLQCWVPNPDSRPTFVVLEEKFKEFCRVPQIYVVLTSSEPLDPSNHNDQSRLVREVMDSEDSSQEDDDDIMDPINYCDSDLMSQSESFDLCSSGGLRGTRRLTSTGSKRYLPEPLQPILKARQSSEMSTDDGNYLVPTIKTREQQADSLYTPVIVNENGDAEYYNQFSGDGYYNDIVKKKNSQADVLEKIAEESEAFEKESCL